jgi:CRP-like cAMP-binding protein
MRAGSWYYRVVDEGELIRTVPIFSELSEEEVAAVARHATRRQFAKDAVIFFENEPGDTLYVVAAGRVRVSILGDDGREVILSVLGPGDFFGEMALLDNDPRSATTIAAEDTELLCLSRPDFEKVMRESPTMMMALIKVLTTRLRHANQQISTLALLDVYGRVAHLIVEMAQEEGRRLKDGRIAFRRSTHQEIASRIGTTRETVTRMLKDLQRQKLVHVEGKEFVVGPDFEKAFD